MRLIRARKINEQKLAVEQPRGSLWRHTVSKSNNPMKNTLLATVAALAGFCATAQDRDFHLDKEYALSPTGTIHLNSGDAKVFVTGSRRSTTHVKIDYKVDVTGYASDRKFHVDVMETGGDLKIQEVKSAMGVKVVGMYTVSYRIEIEAPEGASLKFNGDDGHYTIKNVNGAIQIHADDADVDLTGCKGNKFVFRMDDGDVRMDQGRGSLDIEGDDLDATISNAAFTEILADIDDGSLIIETSLDNKGNYSFRSEDGTIALTITKGGGEFFVRHDDTHVVTQGNFNTLEQSEDFKRVALADGSAKVNIRAEDGRVRLIQASR